MLFPCTACDVGDPARCGKTNCPVLAKYSGRTIKIEGKEEFQGTTPNVFVGRYGYPHIRAGILSTEQYEQHDAPRQWAAQNYNIPKIISLRQEMVNSTFHINVKSFQQRFLEMSQEIGMAVKPVDIEVKLNKKPVYRINYQQEAAPHGPTLTLEKAQFLENPKIPRPIEYVVSDTDLRATEAIGNLHEKGFDEHQLTKLLSIGTLGVKIERKLVPTRWSITAVDDILGKQMIENLQDYPEMSYQAYYGGYLGNYYLLLFFPGPWSYELFEMNANGNLHPKIWTDYESIFGRKTYASNSVGGYYACRHGILEKLNQVKRKASVLALRFTTPEYTAPLGVWVCREATRKALSKQPLLFSGKEEMIQYAIRMLEHYKIDPVLLRKSRLLHEMNTQTRLDAF